MGPEIYNFNLRPDDVWIITFPRSASKIQMSVRFPQIDFSAVLSDLLIEKVRKQIRGQPKHEAFFDIITKNAVHMLNETNDRRFIKTHLPISLLPPTLLDTCK
ncbi:hypothetical protein B566_EDAN011258, partial [Ephemera danica]